MRALDCLSDYRTDPDFSSRCATALTEYLAEAARDIRTMAGLQQDCKEEISTMCKGEPPGAASNAAGGIRLEAWLSFVGEPGPRTAGLLQGGAAEDKFVFTKVGLCRVTKC